jgi:hypothetical protein
VVEPGGLIEGHVRIRPNETTPLSEEPNIATEPAAGA